MKKKYLKIIACTSVLLLTGCFGLWDSGSDRITGNYIVLWIDQPENQTISEEFEKNSAGSSQLVPEYVFAVGHNDNFIIAKQHPTSGFDDGFKIDTKITNYFIVDMNRKILKKGEKVFGPLKLKEFDSLRTALEIQNIKFNQIYPDKP